MILKNLKSTFLENQENVVFTASVFLKILKNLKNTFLENVFFSRSLRILKNLNQLFLENKENVVFYLFGSLRICSTAIKPGEAQFLCRKQMFKEF